MNKRGILLLSGCLSGMLPLAVAGQTTAPFVTPRSSDSWMVIAQKGGMRRNAEGWYMKLPDGLVQSLMVMNYVDGYSIGPHAIWGHVNADRNRWELEETVRWACSRECWVAKGSLRYIWPAEWQSFVTLYGGQHTEDFDENPFMPQRQSLLATGIFGWSHYKLLERTQAGFCASTHLGGGLQLTGDARWERRRALENHRQKNIFGAKARPNVPLVRDGQDETQLTDYTGPIDGELLKASLRFDLLRNQTLYVVDDMTAMGLSPEPYYSVKVEVGQGLGHEYSSMRFVNLELSVKQAIKLEREGDQLRYLVGAGTQWSHGEVGLADWHHFDASRFWWQTGDGLTYFALLDNYEFSSRGWWSQAHAEWSSDRLLLTQFMPAVGLRETVGCHVAQVAGQPLHWECNYGLDLSGLLGLSIVGGFDGGHFDGVSFGLRLAI